MTNSHNILCSQCGYETTYVDSKIIYGQSYGMIYYCADCDSYCGVHPGTDEPVGTTANKELREWRKKSHELFDPLWERKMIKDGVSKVKAINLAYAWLSLQMKIEIDYCNINLFDVEQCKRVVKICTDYSPLENNFGAMYAAQKNRRWA